MTTGVLNTIMLFQRTELSLRRLGRLWNTIQERRCNNALHREGDYAVESMRTFTNGSNCGD